MGKKGLAAASLVAAVPAGLLSCLLVMTFLKHTEHSTTMLMVLAGSSLAVSFLIALMPVAILVFTPKTEETEDETEQAKSDEEGEADQESGEEGFTDTEADGGFEEEDGPAFEEDEDDFGDEDLEMAEDDEDVFEAESDEFDFEDEEEK